ncbi:sulfatase-like hydrolase/transferase [Microbulbifer sp. TRSA001]|uniref:sulfatase-like hydrolase/transferase n=1 Tax=Microbulbifer sp. TRSA001 TaxID=3243381 RepID=UPI0040393200
MEDMNVKVSGSWSWYSFASVLLLVVMLPNFFYMAIAEVYSLSRPLINVDYIFIAIFLVVGPRLLFPLLFSLVFFFDALGLIGQIFPILRFSDIPYLLKFFPVVPEVYKLLIVASLFLMVFLIWATLRGVKKKAKVEALVLINCFVLIYLVSALVGGPFQGQVWRGLKNAPVVGSQLVFGFDSRNTGFVDSLSGGGPTFSEVKVKGATAPLFQLEARGDILLVVNESWGVTNPEILKAVISPLVSSRAGYLDVQMGTLQFSGITIAAEMRELCQLYPNNFNFSSNVQELSGCLPNLLRRSGYKTHAFHGAAGLMYDRVNWYPMVGFEEATFFESRHWGRRCYSFPGACDSDMVDQVRQSFESDGDSFSYWLTLNTHSIYDERDIKINLFNCQEFGVPASSQTCRNLKLQAQFFYDLRRLIDFPELEGVEVIVVGDHEPPIVNKAEKEQFFTGDSVPWLKFKVPSRS